MAKKKASSVHKSFAKAAKKSTKKMSFGDKRKAAYLKSRAKHKKGDAIYGPKDSLKKEVEYWEKIEKEEVKAKHKKAAAKKKAKVKKTSPSDTLAGRSVKKKKKK